MVTGLAKSLAAVLRTYKVCLTLYWRCHIHLYFSHTPAIYQHYKFPVGMCMWLAIELTLLVLLCTNDPEDDDIDADAEDIDR